MDKQPAADVVSAVVYGCAATAVFIAWYWLWVRRAKSMLRAWATNGGFRILDFKRHYMFAGSFHWWWLNRPYRIVFRVHVLDRAGRERFGWVRCGSNVGGVLFSNHTEVRWDQE